MESLRAVNRPAKAAGIGRVNPAFDEITAKTCADLLAKVIMKHIDLSLVVAGCIEAGSKAPGGKNMTNEPADRRDALETVRYIQQLARELREMALAADQGFLAYLLAMVEDVAAASARRMADK